MQNKLIVILGMSSAGKDTIAKELCNRHGFRFAVSTTTRPIRSYEQDGVDYHFLSEKEFLKQELVEYRVYNTIQNGVPATWYYGLTKDEIDISKGSVVAVVDPQGLIDIEKVIDKYNIYSIYVDLSYEERLTRASSRETNFEVEEFDRREGIDGAKFKDLEHKVNMTIYNNKSLEIEISHIENKLREEGII